MQEEEKSDYQTTSEQLDNVAHASTQTWGLSSAAAQEGTVLQLADGGIQACNASAECILRFTTCWKKAVSLTTYR